MSATTASAAASPSRDNARIGILSMLIAMALMTVMNALAKSLAESYPLTEVTFFRNLFALIPAAAMVAAGGRQCLCTAHPLGHAWRSVIGLTSMLLLFWSYHLMPLANAVAISYAAPLFVTALSVPLLGERVGAHRWSAVGVGFIGVLVMVRPSGEAIDSGALVALAAAFSYALAMIAMRQLGRTERPVTTVFYFTLICTVLTGLTLPFAWITPDWHGFALMALMGLAGAGSQYFSTRAYSLAPAVVIGPFSYSGLLWATLLGWLMWGDVPTPVVLTGAAIVILSGLIVLLREARGAAPAPAAPGVAVGGANGPTATAG